MNNFFKRAACLAVTAVMTLSSTGALACTGYYVGKQASASSHTIIGHTVDAWNTAQAKQVVYPHSEEPGRTVTVGANEVPLPDVTYQYTSTPFIEGLWDSAVANEMGVTMTGSVTTYISDGIMAADPYVQDGASETWISRLYRGGFRYGARSCGKLRQDHGDLRQF